MSAINNGGRAMNWKVVSRANPFVPFVVQSVHQTLEHALIAHARLKKLGGCYAIHVWVI